MFRVINGLNPDILVTEDLIEIRKRKIRMVGGDW